MALLFKKIISNFAKFLRNPSLSVRILENIQYHNGLLNELFPPFDRCQRAYIFKKIRANLSKSHPKLIPAFWQNMTTRASSIDLYQKVPS